MTSTRLTEQQIALFDAFGYLVFPGLLADCIDRVIEEFEAVWAGRGGGHDGRPHDGQRRSVIVPFADQSEYLSGLLDDPRIHDIAAGLLGDDFNYTSGDGNFYVGDTPWHSDGYDGRRPLSIKIAFYLDPVTRTTGCLRVIPGSHRVGEPWSELLQRDARRGQEAWGIPGDQVPAVALESAPGDVVVFNHNLKHASFGGSARRRMFTMNFCRRYPDDRLDELREKIGKEARFLIDRLYGEAMLRTAGPERMVHLEQVLANDDHMPELARQHREKLGEPARG
jgi:Phytanoyl-CoA dioxygenase (PhyH)